MISRNADDQETIDRKTSRSICDAIGEQLQRNLRPETSRPSAHLQRLTEELRQRDKEDRPKPSN